jgi:hypothetical protein
MYLKFLKYFEFLLEILLKRNIIFKVSKYYIMNLYTFQLKNDVFQAQNIVIYILYIFLYF